MAKIKRDDEILVITGKDKGKRGKVLSVLEDRVLVAGINMVKKHVKANPGRGTQGGIVEQESSLHISNVALFNAATQRRIVLAISVWKMALRCVFSNLMAIRLIASKVVWKWPD